MAAPSAPIYLRVDATFKPDGTIVPTTLYWVDGSPFTIDHISDVRPGNSLKHGGSGMRYVIRIRGRERYLFCVQNRWFVEEKDPA